MFGTALHSFDAWLNAPPAWKSTDPGIELRRAQLSGFERIFDLVDAAFEVKRPRAVFHWLYRRNPGGPARCWILFEEGRWAAAAEPG